MSGFLASQGPDAIEVWNEPNIDREWPTGQVNGASYTRLLAAGYQAIKAVNPNIIVISGAPAPTGFWGAAGCGANGCNDDVFMQQMAAAGAAQYMDCLGLHYNEGIVSPTQSGGDPRGGYPTYFFNSMLNRGAQYFPNTKVCWTELGYLSGEGFSTPIPAGFAWASNVSVGQQAQWLAQAAQQSRASGRVLMMIVWNVNFTVWGSDPQAGYAMIRPGRRLPRLRLAWRCDAGLAQTLHLRIKRGGFLGRPGGSPEKALENAQFVIFCVLILRPLQTPPLEGATPLSDAGRGPGGVVPAT